MNYGRYGVIATLLVFLAGCGPSDLDAQKLGFVDAKEMKELTARGYKNKDEYVDAAFRTPVYCFDGGREQYEKRCQNQKVMWVVKTIEVLSAGKNRAKVVGFGSYSDYTTDYATIDITAKGKSPYAYGNYYVVEGLAGSYNTFYPDLNDATYLIEIGSNDVDATLKQIRTTAQIKDENAKKLGFDSYAEMTSLQAKGYNTKQSYIDANQKAKELGFDSVEQQKSASDAGYTNPSDYRKYLKEQEEKQARENYEANRKAELTVNCSKYGSARLSCAGAANYSRCMDITFGSNMWYAWKDICPSEGY